VTLGRLISASGGRTFVLTVGCGLVTSVLQWFGKLDPSGSQFSVVIVSTVGAYIAANAVQRVKAGPATPQETTQ
jgi:hypothetical protein